MTKHVTKSDLDEISQCSVPVNPARGKNPANQRSVKVGLIWEGKKGESAALTNAFVVGVETGTILTGKTVILKNGMIDQIADSGNPLPPGCKTIDCRGSYLIPGLINAHVHLTMGSIGNTKMGSIVKIRKQVFRNYESCIEWGVTTVRDMCAMPKILLKDRAAIEKGELIGPNILTSLGILSVPGGYPEALARIPWIAKLAIGNPHFLVNNPSEARDMVKRLRDSGADLIKIAFDHTSLQYGYDKLNELTDGELEAIRDEAEKNNLAVAAHHMFSVGLKRGLQFQINSMEHMLSDAEFTDKQVEQIVDQKIPFIPTSTTGINMAYFSKGDPYNDNEILQNALHWRETELVPDMPKYAIPPIVELCHDLLNYYIEEKYKLPENRKLLSFNPKIFTRAVVNGTVNVRKLIKAGAVIGVGNDSGVPLCFPGQVHYEMLLLTRNGMTAADALKAATLVNARILRVDETCGSISEGKKADLVLIAGNPIEDVTNVAKVNAVFKDGKIMAKAEDYSFTIGS